MDVRQGKVEFFVLTICFWSWDNVTILFFRMYVSDKWCITFIFTSDSPVVFSAKTLFFWGQLTWVVGNWANAPVSMISLTRQTPPLPPLPPPPPPPQPPSYHSWAFRCKPDHTWRHFILDTHLGFIVKKKGLAGVLILNAFLGSKCLISQIHQMWDPKHVLE